MPLLIMMLVVNFIPAPSYAESISSSQYVIVTAPITDDTLVINKNFVIKWKGLKKARYALILEDESGSKVGIIKDSVKGNSYKWKVGKLRKESSDGRGVPPKDIQTGNKYRIRVVANEFGSTSADTPSNLFLITTKSSKVKPKNDTQTKADNAIIQSTMSSLRAYAELYYDTKGSDSYEGFCSNSKYYLDNIYIIEDRAHSKATCYDFASSYAVSLSLVGESSKWCVDSTGKNSKGVAVNNGSSANCRQ